jgi:hypothetical protein
MIIWRERDFGVLVRAALRTLFGLKYPGASKSAAWACLAGIIEVSRSALGDAKFWRFCTR